MSRQVIIPLVLIAAGLAAIGFHMQKNSRGLSQSAIDPRIALAFSEWASSQREVYSNPTDKSFRLGVFAKNFLTIEAHNSNPSKTWTMGLTTFADLTSEEFLAKTNQKSALRGQAVSGMPSEVTPTNGLTQQAGINWMSFLQQQSIEGSARCNDNYAWVAAVTMNAQYKLHKDDSEGVPAFSPQTYLDCSATFGNSGCSGGSAANAFLFSQNWGIATLEQYPHLSVQRVCNSPTGQYMNSGIYRVGSFSNSDLYNRLSQKNVISAFVDIKSAQFYSKGIFTGACSTEVNHQVVVFGAGFDADSGLNYWDLMNTWGSNWGQNGVLRMVRFMEDGVPEKSSCGLNMYASFPTYGPI